MNVTPGAWLQFSFHVILGNFHFHIFHVTSLKIEVLFSVGFVCLFVSLSDSLSVSYITQKVLIGLR